MKRAVRLSLALFATAVALPAVAQESGGVRLHSNTSATLDLIAANRGCPLSSTSVTIGVNKAFASRSSATQRLGAAAGAPSGCRSLVSTQVAVGANLGLGSGSQAGQSINVQGQRGALESIGYTRGFNAGIGPGSATTQTIQNLFGR